MIITIGRKPFKGSLIDNVKVEGCGGLNINETRIGTEGGRTNKGVLIASFVGGSVDYSTSGVTTDLTPKGRWAANVLLSIDATRVIDRQSGCNQVEATGHEKGECGEGASRYFKKVGK